MEGVQPFLGMWASMCTSLAGIHSFNLHSQGCELRGSKWHCVLYLFLMYLMITQQHPKKDGPRYHNSDVAFVLLLLFCNCGTRSDHQPTTTTHYGLGELFSNMLKKKKWWILILNVEVDVAPGYCGVRRIVVW